MCLRMLPMHSLPGGSYYSFIYHAIIAQGISLCQLLFVQTTLEPLLLNCYEQLIITRLARSS